MKKPFVFSNTCAGTETVAYTTAFLESKAKVQVMNEDNEKAYKELQVALGPPFNHRAHRTRQLRCFEGGAIEHDNLDVLRGEQSSTTTSVFRSLKRQSLEK